MRPRLTSSVLVKALIRTAESQGGVGAVLAKGDALAGAVAVILAERGVKRRFLERTLGPDGDYRWADAGAVPTSGANPLSPNWSRGGGESTPTCGSWNWTSRQPNGSPMK